MEANGFLFNTDTCYSWSNSTFDISKPTTVTIRQSGAPFPAIFSNYDRWQNDKSKNYALTIYGVSGHAVWVMRQVYGEQIAYETNIIYLLTVINSLIIHIE